MRKLLTMLIMPVVAGFLVASMLPAQRAAAADYSNSNLMDDAVFDSVNTMNESQIQSFLASKGPCLADYKDVDPNWNGTTWSYTGSVAASHIIYKAAQQWGLNPQVIISTLQKEESLITGTSCDAWRYNSAMGYGCPDSGGCNPKYAGFTRQVLWGAWQLKFSKERSYGNTAWDGDDDITYVGLMTQGNRSRCGTCNTVYYDGYATIDGQSIYLANGTTAALYTYTPHLGQSFPGIFEGWFGPVSANIPASLVLSAQTQVPIAAARGQSVSYTFSLTNNFSFALTLDAVGVVGHMGSISGANKDLGWQGPVTFQPSETKQFTFSTVLQDTGTLYYWPAVNYQGRYYHYNNWGEAVNVHMPNLSVVTPLTSSKGTNLVAGQTTNLSMTIKNNESQPIYLDAAGIPVRYFDRYNYDTGWAAVSSPLAPGATQTISGNLLVDKPGSYSAWGSYLYANQFAVLTALLNLSVKTPTPNFQLTYLTTPDLHPALGEDVTVSYKLKNNSGVPMTLDAVGVVGRYDNAYSGTNNDMGWNGPVTFADGEEKTFTFTTNVSQLKNYYAWVAIVYKGGYYHYNAWGFLMTPHQPNLTLSAPLTINNGSQPSVGQTVPVTVTIKNNEPNPIKFSALGIPARFFGRYNYDVTWQGPGTLAASGQTGDSIALSGNENLDKPGPYTFWSSALIDGYYLTLGSQQTINVK